MHRILVEEKRWISEPRFLHALSYCTLLPGPEAQQLATYVGWLLHGTRGALLAGGLFVLPGFVSILALSVLYVSAGDTPVLLGVFDGLKPAVLAIVVEALVRIGRRSLRTPAHVVLASTAFVAIFFFAVPFPIVVLLAAGAGLWIGGAAAPADGRDVGEDPRSPSFARTLGVVAVWLAVWFGPIVVLALAFGPSHVLIREALFFSKVAVVTFGGAYAVLGYVAQQAVETYAWLTPGEMLDGLGLAETTPGPLIQVVQFVGFLGAYRNPGAWSPWVMGVAGSVVTTWVTYAPCFLWILAGAPYVEVLRRSRVAAGALGGIMAAVVGVIANLSAWFSLHVLFAEVGEQWIGPLRLWAPDGRSIDPLALVLGAGAFVAIFRWRLSMPATLALAAGAGVASRLLGLS